MHPARTDLAIGDVVRVRGAVWRIVNVRRHETCERLELTRSGHDRRPDRRTILCPFDRPTRLSGARARVVSRLTLVRGVADAAWAAHPWGALHVAAGSRIALYPYQVEPALAIVHGAATRVLLADEVGLGKTIQAGLVLVELMARGLANRILVLTPAGLRDQWVAELQRRFAVDPVVMDAATLGQSAGRVPRGVNPWGLDGVYVTSYDFVKRPEVIRAFEALTWDVAIVDEAHAVSGRSDRRVAVDGLCRRARRVVLLTATPLAGGDPGFEALCLLGRQGPRDERRPLIFRRTREHVGLVRRRRVKLLRVWLTEPEVRMHRLLDQYTRAVWRRSGSGGHANARLAMIVLRKRALSCAASLLRSVERRQHLLDLGSSVHARQLSLPLDDETTVDDDVPDAWLSVPGLPSPSEERAWLVAIGGAARLAAERERKLTVLVRALRRTTDPVIVFTEYRDTLARLADAVGRVAPVALLHGGLTRQERIAALSRFDRGAARVLLATDAAGEGLNLQARCRWVIDFELPWTPARLEQRIGRVDRLGQTRIVHALHLIAQDTAEALVLTRLVARSRRARSTLGAAHGPGTLPDEAVAARVIDADGMPRRQRHAPRAGPTRPVVAGVRRWRRLATAEVERLSVLRRLAGLARVETTGSSAAGGTAPLIGTLAWRRPARTLARIGTPSGGVLFYRIGILDAAGRPIDAQLVPVLVRTEPLPRHPRASTLRAWLTRTIERYGTEIVSMLDRMTGRRATAVATAHRAAIRRPLLRERGLDARARVVLARRLVQPGLFDRRTLIHTERERRAAAHQIEQNAVRVDDLLAGCRLESQRPDLVLAVACPCLGPLAALEGLARPSNG